MERPENCISKFTGGDVINPPVSPPTGHIVSTASLPTDYEPGSWDVICQRGKDCHEHVGNRRFRVCIENHVDTYMNAKTRQDKSSVITLIVKSIKDSSSPHSGGGFVLKDPKTKRWHHVDSKVARDKVGNALRDAIKQQQDESRELMMMLMSTSDPSVSRDQASRDSSLMWMNSQQYQARETVDHSRTDTDMEMTYGTPAEAPAVRGDLKYTPFFNFEEKPSPYFMPQLHQLKTSVSSRPVTGQMNVQRCLQSLELDCFSIGSGTNQDGVRRTTGVPQPVSARDCLQVLIEDTMDEDTFQNQVDLEPRPIGTFR